MKLQKKFQILITLRERPLTSSSWLFESPNFRQEMRSSYYRNDSLKYDLNVSNDFWGNCNNANKDYNCLFHASRETPWNIVVLM